MGSRHIIFSLLTLLFSVQALTATAPAGERFTIRPHFDGSRTERFPLNGHRQLKRPRVALVLSGGGARGVGADRRPPRPGAVQHPRRFHRRHEHGRDRRRPVRLRVHRPDEIESARAGNAAGTTSSRLPRKPGGLSSSWTRSSPATGVSWRSGSRVLSPSSPRRSPAGSASRIS
jgi:hypothetical protein